MYLFKPCKRDEECTPPVCVPFQGCGQPVCRKKPIMRCTYGLPQGRCSYSPTGGACPRDHYCNTHPQMQTGICCHVGRLRVNS